MLDATVVVTPEKWPLAIPLPCPKGAELLVIVLFVIFAVPPLPIPPPSLISLVLPLSIPPPEIAAELPLIVVLVIFNVPSLKLVIPPPFWAELPLTVVLLIFNNAKSLKDYISFRCNEIENRKGLISSYSAIFAYL